MLQSEATRYRAGYRAARVALQRQRQPPVAPRFGRAHRLPTEGERRHGRPVVAAADEQQPSRREAIRGMQQRQLARLSLQLARVAQRLDQRADRVRGLVFENRHRQRVSRNCAQLSVVELKLHAAPLTAPL